MKILRNTTSNSSFGKSGSRSSLGYSMGVNRGHQTRPEQQCKIEHTYQQVALKGDRHLPDSAAVLRFGQADSGRELMRSVVNTRSQRRERHVST
jgi:hypothetical protein